MRDGKNANKASYDIYLQVEDAAPILNTVATYELLCLKNVGTQISMFFTSNEESALMAIEKIKILGAVLELPAKQHCQF